MEEIETFVSENYPEASVSESALLREAIQKFSTTRDSYVEKKFLEFLIQELGRSGRLINEEFRTWLTGTIQTFRDR